MARVKAMKLTEADFQTRRSIGKGRRWTNATSIKGWPDLFFWHPTAKIHFFAELKTETGRLTDEQIDVIGSMRDADIPVYVWRPRDWSHIETVLMAGRRATTRIGER